VLLFLNTHREWYNVKEEARRVIWMKRIMVMALILAVSGCGNENSQAEQDLDAVTEENAELEDKIQNLQSENDQIEKNIQVKEEELEEIQNEDDSGSTQSEEE